MKIFVVYFPKYIFIIFKHTIGCIKFETTPKPKQLFNQNMVLTILLFPLIIWIKDKVDNVFWYIDYQVSLV